MDKDRVFESETLGSGGKALMRLALDVAPCLEHQPLVLGVWIDTQLSLHDPILGYRGVLDGVKELAEIEACFRKAHHPAPKVTELRIDDHGYGTAAAKKRLIEEGVPYRGRYREGIDEFGTNVLVYVDWSPGQRECWDEVVRHLPEETRRKWVEGDWDYRNDVVDRNDEEALGGTDAKKNSPELEFTDEERKLLIWILKHVKADEGFPSYYDSEIGVLLKKFGHGL